MAGPVSEWPLASDAGDAVNDRAAFERPQSRRNFTTQSGHRTPMLRATDALHSHPVPSFNLHRPASPLGQARGRPNSSGAQGDTMRLQIPSPVRPPTRHGLKRSFNDMGSTSPESTGNDAPIGRRLRDIHPNRLKNGLATQLSRGAQVFSSAGSFLPFTHDSPAKTRISAPYGFRHVARAEHGGGPMGGVDHGTDSDPEATLNQTHRVLLDVRTNSRIENRTSLPVAMPNVTSPIDETQFDAGCGHDSSRNSFNPFPSQSVTPATVQVHRPDPIPAVSHQRRLKMPRFNIQKVINGPGKRWSVAFWASIISSWITAASTVAAITSTIDRSNRHEVVPSNEAAWLALSVTFFFASWAAIAITYAPRRTSRVMASHRNSQNEEEMIEMQDMIRQRYSTPTPVRNSDPAIELDDLTQRHVSEAAAAGQNERASHPADITTPEPVHIRQSSRIVAEGLHNLAAPPHSTQSKRASGIFDAESVRTALYAQSIIETRPVAAPMRFAGTPIGIARSESILQSIARQRGADLRHGQEQHVPASDNDERVEDRGRSDSTKSGTTVDTYESMGTDTPMIAKRESAEAESPPSLHPSKEPLASLSDSQVSGKLPHSVAVPDLSSETNIPALPSVETNSTLSSFITSYADESDKEDATHSQEASGAANTKTYNAPRPKEALGSHPVPRTVSNNPFKRLEKECQLPHKIMTEVGTPDSQKSSDRLPSDHRETQNATANRREPMTPIAERSEVAIAECF
ncbi:hypothetical protein PG985_003147 [Apiospora marii]|uniref:uncharacterized protein n=1 Tax=Apiospora marii TaxID=335849 RepID=UPI003130DFEB